jgi:hypothetical protein
VSNAVGSQPWPPYFQLLTTTRNLNSVPFCSKQQNRLAELCLKLLERDGLFRDEFKAIRTREKGVAREL